MNKQQKRYKVLGLMSGTSLDGLDLCLSEFYRSEEGLWSFDILSATTKDYSAEWSEKLRKAHQISSGELTALDRSYGAFLGKEAEAFLKSRDANVDFIASHGHTIFHRPDLGYSLQIGHGATLSTQSGLPCICDFRSNDIALGGQGAPLVPIGDQLLFPEFDSCLNLGGIANISFIKKEVKSFDICPLNLVLNSLSSELGLAYDAKGKNASQGVLNTSLLNQLNELPFYREKGPKSLGREWLESSFLPLIQGCNDSPKNKLRTCIEHQSQQIAKTILSEMPGAKVLITGGGAKNQFLIEKLKQAHLKVHLAKEEIIDFKEALIFGFLGVLRYRRESNALKSVTGALKDSIGGCIYLP